MACQRSDDMPLSQRRIKVLGLVDKPDEVLGHVAVPSVPMTDSDGPPHLFLLRAGPKFGQKLETELPEILPSVLKH